MSFTSTYITLMIYRRNGPARERQNKSRGSATERPARLAGEDIDRGRIEFPVRIRDQQDTTVVVDHDSRMLRTEGR